jgi:hypothetical protein
MKNYLKVVIMILLFVTALVAPSCGQKTTQTGLLQGGVTIGPITPVEIPGQNPTVPPQMFSSRKVLVYDSSGTKLVKELTINQIEQTAHGYYSVQLDPGVYMIDVTSTGISGGANLPQNITISAGQTATLDIDIDTGIR